MLKRKSKKDNEEYRFYNFYHMGKVVGRFSLRLADLSIWSVSIDEKYRGKGLGKKMMREALSIVKKFKTEFKSVWLTVNPNNTVAKHIYESLGFKKIGAGEFGWVDRMELKL